MTQAQPNHDGDMLPVQALFSYDVLDAETQEFADKIVYRIRQRNVSMAQAYIDNGKDLLAAKERIPPRMWQIWVEEELGWSPQQASIMMRVARTFGHIQMAESEVSNAALRLLSQYNISDTVRQQAVDLLHAGSLKTTTDVIDLVKSDNPETARHIEATADNERNRRNRNVVRDLPLQVAELTFAVRNMQMALSTAYGVPFRAEVADALERLQRTADILIQLVPSVPSRQGARQGYKISGSKSKFSGVWQHSAKKQGSKTWQAQIKYNGKTHYLGIYLTEEEAARAYDAKARELYGDQARLNFPDG